MFLRIDNIYLSVTWLQSSRRNSTFLYARLQTTTPTDTRSKQSLHPMCVTPRHPGTFPITLQSCDQNDADISYQFHEINVFIAPHPVGTFTAISKLHARINGNADFSVYKCVYMHMYMFAIWGIYVGIQVHERKCFILEELQHYALFLFCILNTVCLV